MTYISPKIPSSCDCRRDSNPLPKLPKETKVNYWRTIAMHPSKRNRKKKQKNRRPRPRGKAFTLAPILPKYVPPPQEAVVRLRPTSSFAPLGAEALPRLPVPWYQERFICADSRQTVRCQHCPTCTVVNRRHWFLLYPPTCNMPKNTDIRLESPSVVPLMCASIGFPQSYKTDSLTRRTFRI